MTNAVWIPGVFSCCFLNPQFSLYPDTADLMPRVSSGCTGTCQKEIRQRTLETKETMASETHGELCLTSSLTLTRPELCWATGRLSSCRISYLFPRQAVMALTEDRWLQVSTDNTGRHSPSQPCCSYSGRTPTNPGVLNVLASQIPCKRKTQT